MQNFKFLTCLKSEILDVKVENGQNKCAFYSKNTLHLKSIFEQYN